MRRFLGAAVLLAAVFALYAAAIRPDSFGFYHDDGIYVVTAKGLATGQGYKVISLPGEPVQTKSPPFHPFLLSLIWRANPEFPDNLTAMMLLSALGALASSCLAWRYLTRHGYASKKLALLIAALFAINWRTVILASGIYSEMFYTALSIGALHLAEEYGKERKKWAHAVALGGAIGFAFLTRSAGIALLVAIGAYYILRVRSWRMARPLVLGSLFVIAWIVWGYVNRPTVGGINAAYHESYLQTLAEVVREAGEGGDASAVAALFNIVGRNAVMSVLVTTPLIVLGIPYDWPKYVPQDLHIIVIALLLFSLVFILKGFFRLRAGSFRLLHWYVMVYAALHLLWPYRVHDRFLMPIVPFLLLFGITECKALAALVNKELASAVIMRKVIAAFVGLLLIGVSATGCYGYASGLYLHFYAPGNNYSARAAEDTEAIQWIKENADPSDVLICYRDTNYYLHTGCKAAWALPLRHAAQVSSTSEATQEQISQILRIITENDARYLILTAGDLESKHQTSLYKEAYKKLVEERPHAFVPVLRSADGRGLIYRIQNGPNGLHRG